MNENTLLLGFREVDITPDKPVRMIGFGREDEMSRGVMDPLMAQASVWRRGDFCCCLIAIDHIGFSREHADELRDAAGALFGAGRERVMLCFSHTHAAPNDSEEPEFYANARERILIAVQGAAASMQPVLVGWANGYADIGVNRREGCEASLDRRVGVLAAQGVDDGRLKLVLMRLTAHANVLKGDNYLISTDYFGDTRRLAAGELGCPVMLTQGASGDIAPRFFDSALNPPDAQGERFTRTKEALELMAHEVLRAAHEALRGIEFKPVCSLAMYTSTIELFADVPTEAQAQSVADDALRYCGIDGTAWLNEASRLRAAGIKEQRELAEVQFFALDGFCLCGVPNEVMCDFALRLEKATGNEYFYFGGYTNGCTGYFPTEEEFDKGGYEVYWSMLHFFPYYGRVYPLRRESCGMLIDFAAENAPHLD